MERRDTRLSLLLAGSFLLFAMGGWSLPFLGPDEPRYSQVSREMLQRHDYLTPTLAGQPWFEKPVLLYWLQIASYKLFGVNEWAARFPSMLAGVLTVFLIACIVRRFTRAEPALLCAMALATSVFLVGFAHAATFDMLLTACVTASLCAFLLHEVEPQRPWLWLAYAAAGAGILAKGFVAPAVIGFAMLTYLIAAGRMRLLAQYRPIAGGLLMAAIAGVWFIPISMIHGMYFWNDFFFQHHLARYTSSQFHRSEGLLFYVPILLLGAFPWTPGILLKSNLTGAKQLRLFAWCWMLSSLAFFSLSQSKLPGYILPAAPAFAILAGTGLYDAYRQKNRTLIAFSVWIALVSVALLAGASRFDAPKAPIVAMATAILILTGAGLWFFSTKRPRTAVLMGTCIPVLGMFLALFWIYPRMHWDESRKLADSVRAELNAENRLLLYNIYDFSLVFYTNARVELTREGYFPPVQNDRDLYRYLMRKEQLYVVAGNEELDWMKRVSFWRIENILHGPHRSIVILKKR